MPYSYPSNIPDAIKKLPAHAQEIFVAAYNSANKQYDGDEAKANATAWAAVKKKYENVKDKWRVKAMETWHYIDLLEGIRFSEDENPTSEIQVAKIGEWKGHPTGSFKITEEIIGKMAENYDVGQRDVVVDYQHLSLDGGADDAKAAGWVKKLVNKGKDGLWAVVEWTKKAAEMIKEKEYRYISPEFHLNYPDKETGKKQGATLLAVALTNRPFLEGMAPVALSERALAEIENVSLDEILGDINAWLAKAAPQLKGKKGSPAIRLYLRGVKEKLQVLVKKEKTKSLAEESLDDKRRRVSNAYQKQFVVPYQISQIHHWVMEVFETYVIAEREEKFLKVPYTIKDDEVKFGDPVEVEQVYQEKSKPIKSTEGGEEMDRKLLCAQLGLNETATDDEIAAELKRLTEVKGNKALTESLGLKEQATEAEVLDAVKKLKEAGSQSAAEGIVKLADFTQLKTEYAETKSLAEGLKKDNDALKLTLLEKARDEVIGKALTELKILPKAKEIWEKRFMVDPENTRTLIDTLAPVLELKEHGSGGTGATGNAGEQLTAKSNEKIAANPKLAFRDAFLAAQTENPVLAKEYAAECRA